MIGDSTAERIKQEVGCGYKSDELKEIDVRGRHLAEGVPRSFTLTNDEILAALEEPLDAMMRSVKLALEQSPPELAADIAESGIVLTGGGALLTDLDKRISNETGLPVYIAEDPLTCVARGGGKALELTGASVQSLPGGEIYQALASGAIDGAEWIGPYADEKLGFQEVCKFYYTGGFHEPGSVLTASFNRDIYDSLTPSQQSVMFNAAAAATMHESVGATANNAAALERIIAQGVKPMEFPDDVWDLFGEASAKAMDAFMDNDLYAEIRASYNASVSQSTKWLDMADRTFVRQRARVLGL